MYKNKIFYFFNIIVKTCILNFYCCYLSIENLVVSASHTTNMGLKIIQNLVAAVRHSLLLLQHPGSSTL